MNIYIIGICLSLITLLLLAEGILQLIEWFRDRRMRELERQLISDHWASMEREIQDAKEDRI